MLNINGFVNINSKQNHNIILIDHYFWGSNQIICRSISSKIL